MVNPFTKAELERYSRHLIIPEFNLEGQRKLKEAHVLRVTNNGEVFIQRVLLRRIDPYLDSRISVIYAQL